MSGITEDWRVIRASRQEGADMIIELKQAVQQALEALTFIRGQLKGWDQGDPVIDALRAALATQADVTDEQIKEAAVQAVKDGKLSWLGFEKDDQDKYTIPVISKSHYQFARAILALRPERVPMTDEEIFNAYCKSDSILSTHITNLVAFAKAIEAHHGIAAPSAKETP